MDSEIKPQRTSIATHLFSCFTSRSMTIPSRSIPSPGRTDRFRDPPPAVGSMSLSSSLSRRLRGNNGSIRRGQASPMFPTGIKKRSSVLENPEPSSPKVTCIGQVRVKTKKKKKKLGMKLGPNKSQRRGSGGEVNFRRIAQRGGNDGVLVSNCNGGQKWVHLPLIICDSIRAFGAESNCLFPFRPSCGRDGHKGREIELGIGEGREEMEERSWRRRRGGGIAELEIRDFEKGEIFRAEGEIEDEGVSACVPPKNALLLMRCGSDPVRMSALSTRLWESSVSNIHDDDDDDDVSENVEENEDEKDGRNGEEQRGGENVELNMENLTEDRLVYEELDLGEVLEENDQISGEDPAVAAMEEDEIEKEETLVATISEINELEDERETAEEILTTTTTTGMQSQGEELEAAAGDSVPETPLDPKTLDSEDDESMPNYYREEAKDEDQGRRIRASVQSAEELEDFQIEDSSPELKEEETEERESSDRGPKPEGGEGAATRITGSDPDCFADSLLLQMMMREPKLSMEVSKETWVRSADFIRRHPRRPPVNTADGSDEPKKRNSTGSRPPHSHRIQPPPSSCTLPLTAAVASIGEKLVTSVAYEPFALTRCKSEPVSSV